MKTSHIFYYIGALLAGLALVIWNSTSAIYEIIILSIGLLMILSSAVTLLITLFPGKKAGKDARKPSPLFWGPVAGGIILGVLMMAVPSFFVDYLIYTLGILLVICGALQISGVAGGIRLLGLSGWFLAVPVLTIAAGVIIIVSGTTFARSLLMIITGCMFTGYGINGIADYLKSSSLMRKTGSGSRAEAQ